MNIPPPPHDMGDNKINTRPFSPEDLKLVMEYKTKGVGQDRTPTYRQKNYAAACLSAITSSDNDRYDLTEYLFGVRSSSDLTAAQCSVIIDWVKLQKVDGEWIFDEYAFIEASDAIRAFAKEHGQLDLFDWE